MQMMNEPQRNFKYRGHQVSIDLRPVAGRWHWSYRIDNSSPYELSDSGESSEGRALLYAWTDARGRIESMA